MGNRNTEKLRFQKQNRPDFVSTVRSRVEQYFEKTGQSRHATLGMWCKVVFFIACIPFLYLLIVTQAFPPLTLLICAMLLGVAQIMVTINLGHDALHGAFTSNQRLNTFLGLCFDFVGLNSHIWKMTHNIGHHTFTNIDGADPDIDKPFIMRLSPNQERYWFHRFQHFYAWFLYGLIGINWLLISDFLYLKKYRVQFSKGEIARLVGFKLANLSIFVAIPLTVMSLPVGAILFGYLMMQAAGGFTAAVVFQLAHIVQEASFPLPNQEGKMELDWGSHQMATTCNFGIRNPWLLFFFGGLNFQIEHHLFPFIAHGHYPDIAPIVQKTALEYGLPYYESPSFFEALKSHYLTLKIHGDSPR